MSINKHFNLAVIFPTSAFTPAAYFLLVLILLAVFGVGGHKPAAAQATGLYDDLTPNTLTFTGRRGLSFTATWDPASYEIVFSTPNSTFPWDWISFVGAHGAVALNGYPNVGSTFAMSDPNSILGAAPGDIFRIKGNGVLSLAHLTKIGLVIGSGTGAQRAWLSQGTISHYTVAPHYVGYQVQVLGRTATVRITDFNPQQLYSVALIEVSLDNTDNARLVLASDLEPAMDYDYAVELHNRADTYPSFDSANQAIVGRRQNINGPNPVYLYSDQPLHSWSANNLALNTYLNADILDGQVAAGPVDARVAISIQAQPVQRFYIGSLVLDSATRTDPTAAWTALRDARLANLNALPQIDSLSMPRAKFVNLFSNLMYVYLLNPNRGLHYADKAFFYAGDVLIPLLVTPYLMPSGILAAYQEGLEMMAEAQYGTITVFDRYSGKVDTGAWEILPSWYTGNMPDIVQYNPDGTIHHRENYSDVYPTAQYLNALYRYYLVTGDLAFVQSHQANVIAALTGLSAFDSAYDAEYGQDGDLFPNVLVPMSDLGRIEGEYPAESVQAIYAYEDAAELLRLYGLNSEAQQLIDHYATPMRAAYDSTFWNSSLDFFTPIADENSRSHEPAWSFYNDLWAHVVFAPLRGTVGQDRLAQLLTTYTGSSFFEPTDDVHWLAVGSENFATPGRWGLDPAYTNGWSMEGGYFILPNVVPALGYYQLDQISLAEDYANRYLDKWVQNGPYEVVLEYSGSMPGRFVEASMYIEAAAGTTWLLQSALGLEVNGEQVTLAPKLSGQFVVRNLNVTAMGKTAVLSYARDVNGCEHLEIVSNEGLTVTSQSFSNSAWVGPTNGDWDLPENWSSGQTPGCNTIVTIPAGTTVALQADATAHSLTLESGAILDLGSYSLSVEETLHNHGTLRQTRYIDASCTGAQPCRFLALTNLAGDQVKYLGVDIVPTGGDLTMGSTIVAVRGDQGCGIQGNLPSTVNRCFEIIPAAPRPAMVTFYYRAAEANGNATPDVWHYVGGGEWEMENFVDRGGADDAMYVQASDIDAYSPFALSGNHPTAVGIIAVKAFASADAAGRAALITLAAVASGLLGLAVIYITLVVSSSRRQKALGK